MNLGKFYQVSSQDALVERLNNMQLRIDKLESIIGILWITKLDAGLPTTGQSGTFVENTADVTLHVYQNGGWLQLFP